MGGLNARSFAVEATAAKTDDTCGNSTPASTKAPGRAPNGLN